MARTNPFSYDSDLSSYSNSSVDNFSSQFKLDKKLLEFLTIRDYEKYREKAMAPHSSVLVWRIPGMAEPGGLPSMGSHRVGHD